MKPISFHKCSPISLRRLDWALLIFFLINACQWPTVGFRKEIGSQVDELNGVPVYYNGLIGHVSGRSLAPDGYNLGLKYQCVEFVKRYYYQHLKHKMPDAYGHAKDFFDHRLKDGLYNRRRGLTQFSNPSKSPPRQDDLVIFSGNTFNPYGHVAIIASVSTDEVEIIQQNPGPFGSSREKFPLVRDGGRWRIEGSGLLGWLRKAD